MKFPAVLCLFALGVPALVAQAIEPGTGAPNEYIRNLFANAYNRGSFPRLAGLPPAGAVRRHGTTGLIQEFNDSTRSSGRLALIKANAIADPENPTGDVYQVLTDVFAYYGTVGVNTAGYPVTDTQTCPNAACTWQFFDRRYALFAYATGANDTQNITVRDPFYTRWEFLGGINRLGPPLTAETATAGFYGGNSTMQTFSDGVLFNITSGTLNGRLVGVRAPVYALYMQRGGHTGSLGYPTGDEQVLASGRRRQTFEGGSIEYDDTSGPVLRPPVNSILLRPPTTPVRLNVGETLAIEATVLGSDGAPLTDRQVNWITTSSRVATVPATGPTAQLRAVGGGTARITATSEGKSSAPIEIIVASQCCAIGEGAPSAAIQQAFLDAVARNRLQVRLPGPERVRRSGAGYVQEFQTTDPAATRYLLTISDRSPQAYVVTGAVLTRYEQIGGPPSYLGFPTSDATAAGRQVFEGGALAGNPVRVVSGAILLRWSAAGFEDGRAGLPVAESVQATSFTGTSGAMQRFANAIIAGTSRGAYLVLTPVAEHYMALEGALGALGFPVSDETAAGGVRSQEFEGGSLERTEGSSDVRSVIRERKPSASVVPANVVPGSRVRVTITGFPDASTLRVTVTGQPEFVANAPAGSFSWEFLVPSNTTAGVIRIRAMDASGTPAETSYTVRSLAEARVQLTKLSGDAQSGVPGGSLPNPLRVGLRDDSGNPVSGVAVRFTASPGSTATPESAVTDAAGLAESRLRLPAGEGIALLTAEAARQVVTFSARATGASITGFPRLMQTGTEVVGNGTATLSDAGALLAATASVMRYYQGRGEAGTPNGLASAASLNDFLRRSCTTDSQGVQVCDGFIAGPTGGSIVNVARLGQFTGGGIEVSVERPEIAAISSLVASGTPAVVALSLTSAGHTNSHFVVANGMTNEGVLTIHDPDPVFARSALREYLEGFEAGGEKWQGKISGVLRLSPRRTGTSSFLIYSTAAGLRLASPTGECGFDFVVNDQPARSGKSGAETRIRTCDGGAQEYQLELDGEGEVRATVIDIAEGGGRSELAGGGSVAFRITRPSASLVVASQTASVAANSVLNSATFTPDIAAGGLVSIFGSGLSRTGRETRVSIGGRTAAVVASFPFQVNAHVPVETPPGTHVLRLDTAWGTAEQPVEVRATAPAVFRTGDKGIVINQNGTLNSPAAPARRGETVVVYATGLGRVTGSGTLRPVEAPVTALIRGQEMRVSYAGLTPGFIGLYQINIVMTATLAPGIDVPLTLRQGLTEAIPVEISLF